MKSRLLLFFMISFISAGWSVLFAQNQAGDERSSVIFVQKTDDFMVTGDGSNHNWSLTEWVTIPQRRTEKKIYSTKAKVLYSETGIYFLFYCEDKMLTATMDADFMDLWKEDVVEIFLMPDEHTPVYFEYEISPLNYELPILIVNDTGNLLRWMPFHYDSDRRTSHTTSVAGGNKKSNASVSSWTAAFFIPYTLLKPITDERPKPGTRWKANLCRIDYDDSNKFIWSWQLTNKTFHDYRSFGTLIFK